jgi:hypothetical protein
MKQCEIILIISELKPLFLFPRKFLIYTTSIKWKAIYTIPSEKLKMSVDNNLETEIIYNSKVLHPQL